MTIHKKLSAVLCAGLLVLTLGGCKQEGPAERAGKELDEAAEKLGEAVEKRGPLERAGEKMDNAVDDAKEALEETGETAKKATE
jgi:hypothetical protein